MCVYIIQYIYIYIYIFCMGPSTTRVFFATFAHWVIHSTLEHVACVYAWRPFVLRYFWKLWWPEWTRLETVFFPIYMPGNNMFGLTLRAMFSLHARNPCAFWHFWSIWYPEWTCLETCFACMPGNNMCCHFEDHCLLKCMNTNCFTILFKPLVPRVDVFGNRVFPICLEIQLWRHF